jgi:c-di-GMP-related signal transduction protein
MTTLPALPTTMTIHEPSAFAAPADGKLLERFISRHPVFNREQKLHGYELACRDGAADFLSCSSPATAAIAGATMSFSLHALTGAAKVFLRLDLPSLRTGAALLLPREHVILQIPEQAAAEPDTIEACRALCKAGYLLSLDRFEDKPEWQPILNTARYLNLDFQSGNEAARRAVSQQYLPRGFELIANRVDSIANLNESRRLSCSFFQGFYFCQPTLVRTREIPGNRLARLHLLDAVAAPVLSYPKIEEIFRQDPALTYKLLRFLNSPKMALRSEVHSIRHALGLLGESEFRRWVSVITVGSLATDKPEELLRTALTRALFCEQLGRSCGLAPRYGELFLMGLVSVMDALLDCPMPQILSQLPLSSDIRTALAGGKNIFRDIYDAMLAYERADWLSFHDISARANFPEANAPSWYLSAIHSADSVSV